MTERRELVKGVVVLRSSFLSLSTEWSREASENSAEGPHNSPGLVPVETFQTVSECVFPEASPPPRKPSGRRLVAGLASAAFGG
jgi:hypothetical protein